MKLPFIGSLAIALLATPAQATVIFVDDNGNVTVAEAVDYLSPKRHSVGLVDFLNQPVTWPERRKLYAPFVTATAMKYGLPESLLHAVILTESHYNPSIESSKGAKGLMQLMPATAERFGVVNRADPEQNIDGGARYLQFLLNRFHGQRDLALAAYNAGEGNVDKYGGIPPFDETQAYVKRINHILEQELLTASLN